MQRCRRTLAAGHGGAQPPEQRLEPLAARWLDGTDLLDYHARMGDPVLARFVRADSVVPGSASGSMDGVQLRPLTVAFHEPGFAGRLNSESAQPFWFQMSDDAKQQVGEPWGPQEAQALNRYSYVQNGPVSCSDATRHYVSHNVAQAKDAARRLLNDRTKIHNARMGGGSNFDAASVAEDIVAVLVGAEETGHAPIGLCEAILITP